MRSRGPRGLTTGAHQPLIPIAWGEVQWDTGVPSWRRAGGEFGATPPNAAGGGPVSTSLVLARSHRLDRLHVQVSPQGPAYAFEDPSLRQPNGCIVYTLNAATNFSIAVFEEQ